MFSRLRRRLDFDLSEDDAAELFSRLHQRSPQAPAAFLDSSDHARTRAAQRSRCSILAFALGESAEVTRFRGEAAFLAWAEQAWAFGRAETGSRHPGGRPDSQFGRGEARSGPDFQLGWVGHIGYDLDAVLFRATHAVVVDHQSGSAEIQTLGDDASWVDAVRGEIRSLSTREGSHGVEEAVGQRGLTELSVRDSRHEYLMKIAAAQEQIRAGHSYEVCLTTAVTGRFAGSPWQAYLQLRVQNRAPFTQYLHLPGAPAPEASVPESPTPEACDDVVILSTSPERFAQISPSGTIRSEPIKGTRPRGADAAEDARLREDLASHPKDRAENVMIADLVRNDLSICAVPGTLRTERLCAVETYPSVHQMVSTISAQLAPGASHARALAAAFPPGSMTGAPKISTMNILRRLETGSAAPTQALPATSAPPEPATWPCSSAQRSCLEPRPRGIAAPTGDGSSTSGLAGRSPQTQFPRRSGRRSSPNRAACWVPSAPNFRDAETHPRRGRP